MIFTILFLVVVHMDKKIGPFKLYTKIPNDIKYGHIYTMDVILPVPNCKKRTVRVYLPENFDKRKRYPVMYMTDGQNIVDKYTTAYGAWDIDIRQHELIKQGYPSFIVVGIDCPKVGMIYRVQEYSFMDVPITDRLYRKHIGAKAYSDVFIDYVVNKLKPIIDDNFPTIREKEFTAIGGSSMGGIAAFNFATMYPEVFGFALSFSPAFHIYRKKELHEYIESLNINPERFGRFYFYTGNVGFEHSFFKPTIRAFNYFKDRGFDDNQVALLVDSTKAHCEAAWSEHFPSAIKFWLGKDEID